MYHELRKRGIGCRRGTAGFMLIEVLVALAVVAVALAAIGSLIATTVRGARSLDTHLMLAETARMIATALPDRDQFKAGNFSGELAGHRWRVDVLPFTFTGVDPQIPTPWVPQTVVIRIQSPSGPILQFNTVRLRRREAQ
jgi:general secretion pathway protein I